MKRRPTRVLILGGGFGGLHVALELQRLFRDERELELTLVNRENFFLFTPMLHEVAASDLDVTHIVNPIRALLKRGVLFVGEVEGIDLERREVSVSHAGGDHRHVLAYDHLVLALGSVTNFFGLPGLPERAFTMKTLGEAIALRNRLIQLLEEADFECAVAQRHDLLTVVVAGGGFAGVETVAAVNDFVRESLRFYPHLIESDVRVVLVEPGPVLLPELSPDLGRYAAAQLVARGVEVRLGTRVTAASESGVTLSDGEEIATKTIVWTAGTSANPLLATLPCEKDRGRIRVNEYLEVPGWPGVWALGDGAAVPNPRTGKPHPPTAQHALREGRTVARNLAAAVREDRGGRRGLWGRTPRKRAFTFSTLGQLAAIGRRAGVAHVFGLRFSGFPAWFLWRTIYLSKLPRLERKVRVALDWTLDLFFSKDLVQFETIESARTLSRLERDGEGRGESDRTEPAGAPRPLAESAAS